MRACAARSATRNSVAKSIPCTDNFFVRFPILTTFFVSVGAFIAFLYVGDKSAEYVVFKYKQTRSFESLGKAEAKYFRDVSQSVFACSASSLIGNVKPETISQQIRYLESLRAIAPSDVRPMIDLQMATDEAVLARTLEDSGKPSEAGVHREVARALLRGLGWRDTSDDALMKVGARDKYLFTEFPL